MPAWRSSTVEMRRVGVGRCEHDNYFFSLNVSRRLPQTVADSIHTARRDATRQSSYVGRCELAVRFIHTGCGALRTFSSRGIFLQILRVICNPMVSPHHLRLRLRHYGLMYTLSILVSVFFIIYSDEYVCLSIQSHISETTLPNFTKFSLDVACDHGSVLPTLCTSGFVDDVMFPDSWLCGT